MNLFDVLDLISESQIKNTCLKQRANDRKEYEDYARENYKKLNKEFSESVRNKHTVVRVENKIIFFNALNSYVSDDVLKEEINCSFLVSYRNTNDNILTIEQFDDKEEAFEVFKAHQNTVVHMVGTTIVDRFENVTFIDVKKGWCISNIDTFYFFDVMPNKRTDSAVLESVLDVLDLEIEDLPIDVFFEINSNILIYSFGMCWKLFYNEVSNKFYVEVYDVLNTNIRIRVSVRIIDNEIYLDYNTGNADEVSKWKWLYYSEKNKFLIKDTVFEYLENKKSQFISIVKEESCI